MDLPADLRTAIEGAVKGIPVAALATSVAGLMTRYRGTEEPTDTPILAGPEHVAAYVAYRMPATYAAVRATLAHVVSAVPALDPGSLLDLGGGTGAASWAAADAFPGLTELTVLDRVDDALALGRRLGAVRPLLRTARWERWTYGPDSAPLPPADLVTISYLLGEVRPPARPALIAAAARSGQAVVVVEPGTPAGYGRVLAARDALLAAGLRVVAPCAHQAPCPLAGGTDWCHFAARVNRSVLHRRAKGATLGYEDEKFSYVAAVASPAAPAGAVDARVLRRPVQRKGLVQVRLCTPAGTAADEIISARQGDRYRSARGLSWGDPWD